MSMRILSRTVRETIRYENDREFNADSRARTNDSWIIIGVSKPNKHGMVEVTYRRENTQNEIDKENGYERNHNEKSKF